MNEDWLTLAEAAQKFAKSTHSIRRLIEKEELKTKKDDRGRVLILSDQLTHHLIAVSKSQTAQEQKKQSAQSATQINDELVGELRRTCDDLRRMLAEEKARSERLEKRNDELSREILKMAKEMQGILEKQTGLSGWTRIFKKD
nr:hypothetical protein GTC16762_33640 [Pigmentibacter ruber]